MSRLEIVGSKKLCGSIKIHGSKNGVLPILAACVLADGECLIKNCPDISDVSVSIKILKSLGLKCSFQDHTVSVSSGGVNSFTVPKELMCEMRCSVIYLGALLSKTGQAIVSDPGGCDLGPRPIDLHISSLEKLGAVFSSDGKNLYCKAENLRGAKINLPFASVGATENIILASVFAKGKTVINNAACEPEIIDLANFLNLCGAEIYGAGTKTVTVCGVKNLHGGEFTVSPDRIETCTYLSCFAATGGSGEVCGVRPNEIKPFLNMLKNMGCSLSQYENSVKIFAPERLLPFGKITTGVYPEFPTDAGPLAVALSSVANGKSEFYETVFPKRFAYLPELKKAGAKIVHESGGAEIYGVEKLHGAFLKCTDLRAGAALVVAGLSADGVTDISDAEYIDRGYEKIEQNLSVLGADIKRI